MNRITMYRLTLYYLILLVLVALIFSVSGIINVSPLAILLNTLSALVFGYLANYFLAKLFKANSSIESVFITALILVLIVPPRFPDTALFIIGAVIAAMASKYFLTVSRQHLFNPAAVAVVGIGLLSPEHSATWWVGTSYLAPFVFVGGLILIRKIHRGQMVLSFLLTYALIISLAALYRNTSLTAIIQTWQTSFTKTALFFFTFVMLTEPMTSPGRKLLQNVYAVLVAVLYSTPQLRFFNLALTPDQALVLGNIFSHSVSPKERLELPLNEKIAYSADTLGFKFKTENKIDFVPGQYMEWALSHSGSDSRGNRRYFSLASSPTEDDLLLTVKFYHPSSSFKRSLYQLPLGEKITASQLSGDFVLPTDTKKPLVFIAGGVGIAPYRSMIKYIVDKEIMTDIYLFYSNNRKEDVLFKDLFDQAKSFGVKTIYTLTDKQNLPADWDGKTGFIDETMITSVVPGYQKRLFYISGPQLMVQKFEELLKKMKVPTKNVIVDYFPGYAEK